MRAVVGVNFVLQIQTNFASAILSTLLVDPQLEQTADEREASWSHVND